MLVEIIGAIFFLHTVIKSIKTIYDLKEYVMEFREYGNITVVRLDKGEEIIGCIKSVAESLSIKTAVFTAIGATDCFTVGVFDIRKQDYERFSFSGNHEITNLSGNITSVDSKPYVHAHITCAGKNAQTVGGHLLEGRVSLTLELEIIRIDAELTRKYDKELSINRFCFE